MTTDRWLTVIGIVASCFLSWLISRHFYRRSDKRRIPTFVVRPSRKTLVDPGLKSVDGWSVLLEDREVGVRGITEAQIYFWNSGTLPILQNEILEPFIISFPEPILRCSVLKSNRDAIGMGVSVPELIYENKLLLIRFTVLEPGDGATIQVIYDGPPDAQIEFKGACVGAAKPTVLPPDNVYFIPLSKRLFDIYGILLGVPALAILFAILIGIGWVVRRFLGEHVLNGVMIGFFFTVLTLGFGSMLWDQYKKITAPSTPPDIRP